MATGLCPNCGTARMGSFRFCRSCGLDYDSPVPTAPTAAPSVLTAAPDAVPPVPPTTVGQDVPRPPTGDVIVIQIQQLKLWAGAIIGGLVGVMLAGAAVVPFFGEGLVLLGALAAVVIVVVSAWLGVRFVLLTTRRRSSTYGARAGSTSRDS